MERRSLYVSCFPFYVPCVAKYEDLRGDDTALLALTGRAWRFGDHLTSQQILAAEHLSKQPTISSAFAMKAVEPQFTCQVTAGDFIVAGTDFAADVAHRNVALALRFLGIAAVIARSFGHFFSSSAIRVGLPALVVEETGAIRNGDRLRVDIEAHIVANLSSGDRYVIRNIDDAALAHLRKAP